MVRILIDGCELYVGRSREGKTKIGGKLFCFPPI